MALLVVSGGFVGVAAAGTSIGASQLDFSSDYVPNPELDEKSIEKETHRMGSMELTEYEGDNGEIKELDAHLNDSATNPITLRADAINESEYRKGFGQNGGTAINASLWTVGGQNSTKASVTASTTPSGVSSVKFATDGSMASGDVATFTFDAGISSDPNKRVAQIVGNINTLDSSTNVEVIATDADGDDKVAYVNSSMNAGAKDVIANATGNGVVYQHTLGDLTTKDVAHTGSGDGTFEGVDKIVIVVEDGDATMNVAGMNYEKMGKWTFGEKKVNTDDDDELETVTHTEPSGSFSVTKLGSLGPTFDDAIINNAQFPVIYSASDLDAEDVSFEVSKTQEGKYPNFGFKVDAYYRLSIPSAYDLVHSGVTFEDTQTMTSGRYKTVEIAEGVGDTKFSDISSWNDVTGSYSAEGSNITLDSTVEPGKQYAVHYNYVITSSNKETLKQTTGAVVGGGKEGDSGIVGSALAILASLLSVVGLGKIAGKVSG